MIVRFLTVTTILSFSILVIMLHTTSPSSVGTFAMLAMFLLGYLSLLGAVTFLLYYGAKLVGVFSKVLTRRTLRVELTLKRAYLYASILATLPMIAIGLYSTGGVAWYELLLLLLFGVIGLSYVAKRV